MIKHTALFFKSSFVESEGVKGELEDGVNVGEHNEMAPGDGKAGGVLALALRFAWVGDLLLFWAGISLVVTR